MALDLGLPILPVTITGIGDILHRGLINLMPGSAKMIVHPPVSIDGYDDANMKTLIVKTRATIISGLQDRLSQGSSIS